MRMRRVSVVFSVLLLVGVAAHADVIWDEGSDGLLSTDPLNPTEVVLVSISDQVIGVSDSNPKALRFAVPLGKTVSSMVLDPGSGFMIGDLYAGQDNTGPTLCATIVAIGAPVEIMGFTASCPTSLPTGDYTFTLAPLGPAAWSLTIGSDVPVELQSFTVE